MVSTFKCIQKVGLIHLILGTIGHVAHGKSTVVKALTGVLTVRFRNERERNITIKLGYANAKVRIEIKKKGKLITFFFNYHKRFTNVITNNVQDQVVIDQLVVVKMMNFHAIDLDVVVNTIY